MVLRLGQYPNNADMYRFITTRPDLEMVLRRMDVQYMPKIQKRLQLDQT